MSLSMDLHGKVALITGATASNGIRAATEFAKWGCSVALVGRDEKKLEKTVDILVAQGRTPEKIHVIIADLHDLADCERVVQETLQRFGQLNVLVNSAAGDLTFSKALRDMSLDEYEKQMKAHVTSVFATTRAAIPPLAETKGAIVNVTSLSNTKPTPGRLGNWMSKAALDGITHAICLELADNGIRNFFVSPNAVDYGIHRWMSVEDEDTRPGFYLGPGSFPDSLQEFFSPISEEAVVLKLMTVVPRLYLHVATLVDYKVSSSIYHYSQQN